MRAFAGAGLRPYAPAHLRSVPDGAGGHGIRWVRRTRIEGDSWSGYDVPLGEDAELYLVRIRATDGTLLREATVTAPAFVYAAADRAADGATGSYRIEIAQISDRFGPGLFRGIDVND